VTADKNSEYKNHVKNRVVIPENKCVDTDMIQVTTPWKDNLTKSIFELN